MKRFARPLAIVAVLCVVVSGVWKFLEWRELREEQALNDLRMTNFEIKGANFDEALRRVVEELHARGHPEVQLHIYQDGRQVPYFRAKAQPDEPHDVATIDVRVVPEMTADGRDSDLKEYHHTILPGRVDTSGGGSASGLPVKLSNILWHISFEFGLPCVIRGHDLVAAHTPGTLQRYRHAVIRCNDGLFHDYTDEALLDMVKQNSTMYEDMRIDVRRASKTVEIYGPVDQVEEVDHALGPHPPPWLEEMKWRLEVWWMQTGSSW